MPRQGRAVVLVNAGVSAAIVAALAGVSVFRSPAAPPTIQEFAPANPGRTLDGGTTTEPLPQGSHASGPLAKPRNTPGVPSALQCFAWPDGSTTQTFDRQSPPCLSSWDAAGGNGGATSRGVTRSEIRVGVPASSVAAWQPLATFFSRHYQLYGRTIRLVPLGIVDLTDPEGQRAAAASAAERGVFATLDEPVPAVAEPQSLDVFLDTLAGAHVVGVLTRSTQVSSTALSAQAPYAWSVFPPIDTAQRTLGTAVCRELSGHRAQHSDETAGKTRRFAALVPAGPGRPDVGSLASVFDRCHLEARVLEYDATDPGEVQQRLASAKADGVTTILPFAGGRVLAQTLLAAASRIGYHPEWVLPGLTQQRDLQGAPKDQAVFGLAAWQKPLPESSRVAAQALREVAPRARFDSTHQSVYDGLALLAAGFQLAGPGLTAQAFADGLETTTFANPGAGAAPSYQARVGFQDVDHTLVDDVAQVWWRGDRFCFVERGKRWSLDGLPFSDPGFFDASKGC